MNTELQRSLATTGQMAHRLAIQPQRKFGSGQITLSQGASTKSATLYPNLSHNRQANPTGVFASSQKPLKTLHIRRPYEAP